ncbi:SH3 domain-containing protein, partial [Pyxidicoccus fallax]|uniref:SH3 domain-containing protein n=1 Tax=Pyxidicoccus fallax TaxID=394095 RepID=UPI0014944D35|nr:SH3 domain-containing protein [Pyxidicoccus fallax]
MTPRDVNTFQPSVPTVASSLRTEQLGDGRSNCLEKAVALARPGDSILLMRDAKDDVGHALVRRPDGSVVDPNHPTVRYETLGQWQAMHPRYGQPVSVPAVQVKQVLSTPPGEKRDALIRQMGLTGVANRQVADEEPRWVTPSDNREEKAVNVRAAPSASGETPIKMKVYPGDKLQVLGEEGDWLKVQAQNGEPVSY